MADTIYNFISNTATISSGQTTSDAIDLQGRGLVAMYLPAAFTGASISFQVSYDGTTYAAAYNTSNNLVTVAVTQGRAYLFNVSDLIGARYIKLVSASSEGGDRSIVLVSRELS